MSEGILLTLGDVLAYGSLCLGLSFLRSMFSVHVLPHLLVCPCSHCLIYFASSSLAHYSGFSLGNC